VIRQVRAIDLRPGDRAFDRFGRLRTVSRVQPVVHWPSFPPFRVTVWWTEQASDGKGLDGCGYCTGEPVYVVRRYRRVRLVRVNGLTRLTVTP
jgi:hypothetical protein